MNCKNCNKELVLTPGRRKKEFCSNNCRVYFWNKLNKKVKSNSKPENKKQIEDSRNKISEASEKAEYPLSKKEATEVKNISADAKKPFMSDATQKESKESMQLRVDEYKKELELLGVGALADKRKEFLKKKIRELEISIKYN